MDEQRFNETDYLKQHRKLLIHFCMNTKRYLDAMESGRMGGTQLTDNDFKLMLNELRREYSGLGLDEYGKPQTENPKPYTRKEMKNYIENL